MGKRHKLSLVAVSMAIAMLFADDAMTLIHNASRGHPRAVNNLALHALTAAFAAGHSIVGEKAARIAISETATD